MVEVYALLTKCVDRDTNNFGPSDNQVCAENIKQLKFLGERVYTIEKRVDTLETKLDAVQENLKRDITDLRKDLNDNFSGINVSIRDVTTKALRAWPPSSVWVFMGSSVIISILFILAFVLIEKVNW